MIYKFNRECLNPCQLLTREQVAKLLGVKKETLAVWKSTKRYKLPVIKIGKLVRYSYADLIEFIRQKSIQSEQDQ